jgi:hypothetical protein
MRKLKLSAVALIATALSAGVTIAQTAPSAAPARTVTALQPGLLEVTGPNMNDAYAAGIQKIVAMPGRPIAVQSPWGDLKFAWPKDVKPVPFTIDTAKNGGIQISAPGFTEANKADYKAAVEAVVPMAIAKARAQKEGKLVK